MSTAHVIRAWKDPDYRSALSDGELALLPAHPSGLIELSDAELLGVDGGTTSWIYVTTVIILVASLCLSCSVQCPSV